MSHRSVLTYEAQASALPCPAIKQRRIIAV